MPTKAETKNIQAEIRALTKALTSRQKQTMRDIKKRRDIIRSTEKEIAQINRETDTFEADTNTRLAILEGRLHS